jgi:hypothetical protein
MVQRVLEGAMPAQPQVQTALLIQEEGQVLGVQMMLSRLSPQSLGQLTLLRRERWEVVVVVGGLMLAPGRQPGSITHMHFRRGHHQST